jgi:hypothetical protein
MLCTYVCNQQTNLIDLCFPSAVDKIFVNFHSRLQRPRRGLPDAARAEGESARQELARPVSVRGGDQRSNQDDPAHIQTDQAPHSDALRCRERQPGVGRGSSLSRRLLLSGSNLALSTHPRRFSVDHQRPLWQCGDGLGQRSQRNESDRNFETCFGAAQVSANLV